MASGTKSIACLLGALLVLAWATSPPVQAQQAGQDKLDEATSLKLNATSPADLGKVIELCEQAMAQGLDEGSERLAKQLLAASAFQRAQLLIQNLPGVANNPRAVTKLRDQTMADLEKAVEFNPRLAEAFVLMAKLQALPGGSRANAMESLNQAIELLKDKPVDQSEAYILRAGLQEDNEGKLADLRKAIEADSTNSDAWQALVALQLVTGKFQEAVDDAKQMLDKDEGNMFALQAAIQALLGLQKTDEAIELLTARIEKDPKNGVFYRVRASAYRMKSFAEEIGEEEKKSANQNALQDLSKAIELNNRDFEALVMRGEIYYEQGEFEKANRDISDSLLIEPNSMRGVMMRSMVAAQEGRYADAIADMEMLVRANPSNVNWIMQLASYYQMDKRPRLAIELLDRLIQSDKDNWRAMRLRGDAKLSVSEHVAAIEDYEAAIALLEEKREVAPEEESSDLDYSGLLNNLAWVLATSPKDDLRDGQRALELGLKACEASNYEAAHILSTLAAAYAEVGDFENARKWSSKAVELGTEENNEQLEQLKKELDSYQQDKPWREEQKVEENERPLAAPSDTIDT
ncbi:MAG: tetratricopeptide repeat protein [Planctomycetales bacterium]|nr:tetratricopeptide repeat protein [Planctomycetales bacterium]